MSTSGMNRLLIFMILSLCLICFSKAKHDLQNKSALVATRFYEESRRKKTGHYFLYPFHGWYALSWIYWIKVKLVVIAFFVGTAFIWAIHYISKYYHQCPSVDHSHYGYYHRSLDDPAIIKFMQNLA